MSEYHNTINFNSHISADKTGALEPGAEKERAVLCGICTGNGDYSTESSMAELEGLAEAAGAQTVASAVQNREAPETATFLGEGKLREVADICRKNGADLLIFDDELSGSQIKNIEDAAGVRVVDRTALILDIFARRARSSEGRIQVELAQLKYLSPRLSGMGGALSRLGGGIGTRGPGETKLETDRRHLRRRIKSLETSLNQIAERRGLLRERRIKTATRTVALVGYTNSGKSTLLNTLTGANVMAKDMLFATLDPTSRGVTLPDGTNAVFIDTVGFIRKLPHQLVEAFHSTLEEASQASLIVSVCDASNPEAAEQLEVSDAILAGLGCAGKPQIVALNKSDLVQSGLGITALAGRETVRISARTGEGLDDLLKKIEFLLPKTRRHIDAVLPYSQGGLAGQLRKYGTVTKEEFFEDGIHISAEIENGQCAFIDNYLVNRPD